MSCASLDSIRRSRAELAHAVYSILGLPSDNSELTVPGGKVALGGSELYFNAF